MSGSQMFATTSLAACIATMQAGTRPSGGAEEMDQGVPSLGGENITRNALLNLENLRRVPKSFFANMKRGHLVSGDVLINKDGAQTGKVARYRGELGEACINEHLFLLRPNNQDLRPDFLYWVMRSAAAQAQIARYITGSAQPGLNQEFLTGVRVPKPSILEQGLITDALDMVEENISKIEAIILKLQQVRSAALEAEMSQAVRAAPLRRLGDLTNRIVDGVHHTPSYVSDGVPFLTVENLTRGDGISLTPCRYVSGQAHGQYRKRIEPLPGDVLVSKDGTLGVARTVPRGFPQASVFVSVAVLRPKDGLLSSDYLRLFFDTSEFQRQLGYLSAGTGLRHIHLEHFRKFELPGIDLSAQRRIADAIARFDDCIQSEKRLLNDLRQTLQGLSSELLSGFVRVPSTAAGI